MTAIEKLLKNSSNVFGKLPPTIQKRIKKYLQNPTPDNWNDIYCLIINGQTLETIWKAVIKADPTFPKTGRRTDINNNVISEWERVPEPFLVIRAIQND
jgi:hypothetical protein